MKKYLLALTLICTASEMLLAQLTSKSNYAALPLVEELFNMGNGIVLAHVVKVDTYWNEERTRKYGHYTLEVVESSNSGIPAQIVMVKELSYVEENNEVASSAAIPLGTEIITMLTAIPRGWECGYTPRHAYAPAFYDEITTTN